MASINPHEQTATTGRRPGYTRSPRPFDDSRREQGIMNQYLRPSGDVYAGGNSRREQAIMNQYAGGNSRREQAIMNQYTRPRGDVYVGGTPGTGTMAALMGGMNLPDLEGIMQMAYRPGAYGTDYDYDDYGPFVPQSVFEMDEFGGEYDPVDDEYLFDLLRGNLTSIGQGIG